MVRGIGTTTRKRSPARRTSPGSGPKALIDEDASVLGMGENEAAARANAGVNGVRIVDANPIALAVWSGTTPISVYLTQNGRVSTGLLDGRDLDSWYVATVAWWDAFGRARRNGASVPEAMAESDAATDFGPVMGAEPLALGASERRHPKPRSEVRTVKRGRLSNLDDSLWPSVVAEPVEGGRSSRYDVVYTPGREYSESGGERYVHLVIREVDLDKEDDGGTWMSLDGEHIRAHEDARRATKAEVTPTVRRLVSRVIARDVSHRLYPLASLPRLREVWDAERREHDARWSAYRAAKAIDANAKPPGEVKPHPRPPYAIVQPFKLRARRPRHAPVSTERKGNITVTHTVTHVYRVEGRGIGVLVSYGEKEGGGNVNVTAKTKTGRAQAEQLRAYLRALPGCKDDFNPADGEAAYAFVCLFNAGLSPKVVEQVVGILGD